MARWMALREAATALEVSEITLKRRIKAGSVEARQEKTSRGFKWLVAVPDEVSQPPQTDVERQLSEIIQLLREELGARRREVAELHVVIDNLTRQQTPQLAPPVNPSGTLSAEVAGDTARGFRWWQVWKRRKQGSEVRA
jgi:hypothetical protein